jgi:hypothetical protein
MTCGKEGMVSLAVFSQKAGLTGVGVIVPYNLHMHISNFLLNEITGFCFAKTRKM